MYFIGKKYQKNLNFEIKSKLLSETLLDKQAAFVTFAPLSE
jgi:hypothetical protein